MTDAAETKLVQELQYKIRLAKLAREFTSENNDLYIAYKNMLQGLRQSALNNLATVAPSDTAKIVEFQKQASISLMAYVMFNEMIKEGDAAQAQLNDLVSDDGYKD